MAGTRIKQGVVHGVLCLLFAYVSIQALLLVLNGQAAAQHLLLVLATAALSAASAYMTLRAFSEQHLTEEMAADRLLVQLAFAVPLTLVLIRFLPFPTTDETRPFLVATVMLLIRVGVLLDLPLSHSLMQWMLSYPALL